MDKLRSLIAGMRLDEAELIGGLELINGVTPTALMRSKVGLN